METTITDDTILELRQAISAPGFHESRKNERRTLREWKARYPFLPDEVFRNANHFGEFRPVAHDKVEVVVMVTIYWDLCDEVRQRIMEALNDLRSNESCATDTTIAYANRLAHDALKQKVEYLLEPQPRQEMEERILVAWQQHHGIVS